MKIETSAERLIVAADFDPRKCGGIVGVHEKAVALAKSLKGTGVTFKVNSLLRALGYDFVGQIRSLELGFFADLKLTDIGATLELDGSFLSEAAPELLTVMCGSGVEAMRMLKTALPRTEVLGVTILTSLKEAEVRTLYGCGIEEAVLRLATWGAEAGIDGFICSPKEATLLKEKFPGMTINTPAIRPSWSIVPGDDQNPERIMTPAKAIKAGADRIVVGRPITQAEDPREAAFRTIEEIREALLSG